MVKEKITEKRNNSINDNELVSAILRLKITRPPNFNWKEDYAQALEEKYANIHRR